MSRLEERIKKLEGNKVGNLHTVDAVLIRPMSPDDSKDEEAIRLEGHGKKFERFQDESEDDFINRAKASIRAAGVTDPVLMLFAMQSKEVAP
jgi:hypothetical protein